MPVTYDLDDHVAVITFDDGKANVYTHEALRDLTDALDRADADPAARAILLVGRPGRFSAGFDLATMTAGLESMRALVKAGGEFAARLLMEQLPVVAACTGHALAAGALVLLAVDHRIGAEGEFRVGLNEVSIGMALPVWAVELARYRIPPSKLDGATILGETWTPEQAVSVGFLDRVVAAGELLAIAGDVAARYAQLRVAAVAGTKTRARSEVVAKMLDGIDEDLEQISPPEQMGR
jgi:enoyl-CoA hydratase